MRKKSMSYIIKTMALLMAGVVGLNAIKVEAAKRGDEITVPEDAWASEYINSLELQSYTIYTQNGDVRGEFYYNASGVLYRSYETVEYEDEEGIFVKKVWDERPAGIFSDVYLYTYRYLDDKTICYMDRYKNGSFAYGRGLVWSADGTAKLSVKYDANREIESTECTYYDEEGRQAYVLSGLSDLDAIDWNEASIYSYEYAENGVMTGYVQTGKQDSKTPWYRQEVVDGQVLLEMEYTENTIDDLIWYAYDKAGNVIYEVSVGLDARKEYSEAYLIHYVYDEQGNCVAQYDYDIVDDIEIDNKESVADSDRSLKVVLGESGYLEKIVSECSLTDNVVVQYDSVSGAFDKLVVGDE